MVDVLKNITDSVQITPSGQIIFREHPLLNFMEFGYRNETEDRLLLQKQLAGLLYEQFYSAHEIKEAENGNFLEELKKNNLSRTRIRKGYTLEITQEIPYTASKGNHRLKLQPGTYLRPDETGSEAWVFLPKESIKDVFYYAYGHTPAAFFREATLRFYFNTGREGSILLMNYLTGKLNKARVPFLLKCVYRSEHIHRPDNFVLYTDYRFLGPVYALTGEIHEALSPWFYPATPLFTLPLRPGIAFAENPSDSQKSFGMSRCGLLAEALVEAAPETEERLQQVIAYIEKRGYDLNRFFLNPGSKLVYPFL